MLTAAELETKVLLTKSLARFQYKTLTAQSQGSQQVLAIDGKARNAMLIDEKQTTLEQSHQYIDVGPDFDAIAPLPLDSAKSKVKEVDYSKKPVIDKHVIDPTRLTIEMQ